MMIPGTNPRSPLFTDLPYWMPDYMVFFGVLYLVLIALGIGLGLVIFNTLKDVKNGTSHH